jgi:hypothetical protein
MTGQECISIFTFCCRRIVLWSEVGKELSNLGHGPEVASLSSSGTFRGMAAQVKAVDD